MSGDKMVKDGEEGMFISTFWLDQATNSFNLVKSMLEERILTVKSLKNTLEERDTRVLELLTTVVELRKTLEERDATISTLNLELSDCYERDTDNQVRY